MEMNFRRARIMGMSMAISFLGIHLFIINVFQQCGVTPMVRFNIFSVIFYVFMCYAAHKQWFRLYAIGVYLEVMLHMFLAVIFTGWDNGFQSTILGMNVLGFYAEYVGRRLKVKQIPMLPFCFTGMLVYLASYIYVHFNGYTYQLPEEASFWLTIIWAIITFVITIVVLQIFVLIVNSSEVKLEHQMSHDKLTGLPNRYYFSNYIEKINRTESLDCYWIAIADVDDFKRINDTYGHNCGDYVLSTIASLFGENKDVLCCRWGGEEFIFISHGQNDGDGFNYLEKLRHEVEDFEFRFNGIKFHVNVTMGMAIYNQKHSIDSWISTADGKLYEGKMNGKNKVVL